MVLKTIDLHTTPMSLEELLELLQGNTEILITKDNVPLARYMPVEHPLINWKFFPLSHLMF